jgi:branched-chain amino acid transport system substrate-binding protein
MTQVPFAPARRRILSAAAGTAVLGTGWVGSALAQAKEFKVGFFIALSGPASLFGPTQRACADLAAEKINKAGGILGRTPAARPRRRRSRRCA